MITPTKRKVAKKVTKKKVAKRKSRLNPRIVDKLYPFDSVDNFREAIEREIVAKSRVNIVSKDGKFQIVGPIQKTKNYYYVEVKDNKYNVVTAMVTFKAEDVLKEDYESATLTLK